MPNNIMNELNALSVSDLATKVTTLTEEYVTLKLRVGAGRSGVQTHRLGEIKRNIARIKTVLHKRKQETSDV